MKTTIAALTALAAGTGGLFAQVSFSSDITADNTNVFSVFVDGLNKAVAPLVVPAADIGFDPNVKYTQFSFGYDGGLAGGSFLNAADVSIKTGFIGDNTNTGKATNLTFQVMDNFPAFVSTAGTFSFGFFGFEAAAKNTVGLEDYDTAIPGFTGNKAVAVQFTNNLTAPYDDSPPVAKAFNIGADPNAFGVYAEVIHQNAPAVQPLYQGDPRYWRIFELVEGDFGGQNVFILALDDLYPRLKDWDDGFFILSGQISPVPEPAMIGLLGVVVLLGTLAYRRRKSAAK